MLVQAWADGSPEQNENESKADQAKGNATRFEANLQHGRHEGMDSEKLVSRISAGLTRKSLREESYEDDQADSEFTNLFDKALCCAIGSYRDDPVVNPLDTEDATSCLQKIEYEKRELS